MSKSRSPMHSRAPRTRSAKFRAAGVEMMFAHIKESLHEFGVDFDVYFHENSLFESGAVDKAVAHLKDNEKLYFEDGAWWLKSTDYGDDKDRVVIKSDGDAAYIAGDIAYVADKFDRGHDLAIYMLGADHHGYIARLRAAAAAMGYNPEQVEVLIGQMVNLLRDGKAVRMSKRAGTVITLDDLVEAIGVDGARYPWCVLPWISPSTSTWACGLPSPPITLFTTFSTATRASAPSCARRKNWALTPRL